MRDVADAANVSVSAVSLVVRGRPGGAAAARGRGWGAISQLGYTVAAPENGKPLAVGLLIERSSMPVILDIFYGDVIRGFQMEAQRLGYQVLLHMFDHAAESLDSLRTSLAGEVDGLVVANDGDITPEMVIQLEALQAPLVLIESYLPGQQLPCVIGDNFTAGYTVMRHLLDLGHRSIAIVGGPRKYSSLTDRLKGVLAAAAETGLLIPPEYMPHPISEHPRKGYVQMQEILQLPQRPTAIVAISDKTAFGALEAIREAGLRVPEDISLVGFDDIPLASYTSPPLTSVRMSAGDVGSTAFEALFRLIGGDRLEGDVYQVPTQLVVRASTAKPKR